MPQSHQRFSIWRFLLLVSFELLALYAGYFLAFPTAWSAQLARGPAPFVAVFLGVHLIVCFFEWFFHRYVLHGATVRWLTAWASEHRRHHSLTSVRLTPIAHGSARVVRNEYAITTEAQFPSSAFPAHALVSLWAFFTPLQLGVQLLLPSLPIMLAGYAAIAWSMVLYEILHAVQHRPYAWWRHATEHRTFGVFAKLVYGFHLMHHANIRCNEGISGFFTFPIADWCFGTYHHPRELLLHGRKATAKDFAIRTPRRCVRWLDAWSRRRESRRFHEAS
jgi:hemolysin III